MTRKSKKLDGTEPSIKAVAPSENIETLKAHVKRLEDTNFALNDALNKFIKELELKDEKIKHLEQMMFTKTPTISSTGVIQPISDEETIAELQLKRLSDAAQLRELTLDEVKRYDLLVKNKRLARGDATTVVEGKKLPANTTKSQLLQIASHKKTEEKI